MTETPTIKDTVAKAERFAVDPQLCIACDACCQDFPEIFFMGQDAKAHAHDVHDSTLYNARTVVDVCPTAAISYTGELPPAEDLSKLEEVPGWELEWAKWRGVEMDPVERDRRYGRDYTVEEEEDFVRVTVQFPTKVPAVRDRFRYGLTSVMPIYGNHVVQDGNVFQIYGWVKDPKIRALCHTTNSFPGQFLTTIELKRTTFGHRFRFDGHQKLEILVFKKPGLAETWQWRSHFITEKCTACTICSTPSCCASSTRTTTPAGRYSCRSYCGNPSYIYIFTKMGKELDADVKISGKIFWDLQKMLLMK